MKRRKKAARLSRTAWDVRWGDYLVVVELEPVFLQQEQPSCQFMRVFVRTADRGNKSRITLSPAFQSGSNSGLDLTGGSIVILQIGITEQAIQSDVISLQQFLPSLSVTVTHKIVDIDGQIGLVTANQSTLQKEAQ